MLITKQQKIKPAATSSVGAFQNKDMKPQLRIENGNLVDVIIYTDRHSVRWALGQGRITQCRLDETSGINVPIGPTADMTGMLSLLLSDNKFLLVAATQVERALRAQLSQYSELAAHENKTDNAEPIIDKMAEKTYIWAEFSRPGRNRTLFHLVDDDNNTVCGWHYDDDEIDGKYPHYPEDTVPILSCGQCKAGMPGVSNMRSALIGTL